MLVRRGLDCSTSPVASRTGSHGPAKRSDHRLPTRNAKPRPALLGGCCGELFQALAHPSRPDDIALAVVAIKRTLVRTRGTGDVAGEFEHLAESRVRVALFVEHFGRERDLDSLPGEPGRL